MHLRYVRRVLMYRHFLSVPECFFPFFFSFAPSTHVFCIVCNRNNCHPLASYMSGTSHTYKLIPFLTCAPFLLKNVCFFFHFGDVSWWCYSIDIFDWIIYVCYMYRYSLPYSFFFRSLRGRSFSFHWRLNPLSYDIWDDFTKSSPNLK